MDSLYDQVPVPKLSGEGEGELEEYLEPTSEVAAGPKRHGIKQFCQSVLHSREYRDSLVRRITSDELPAAVETLLYHFAYGKPVERVEVEDVTQSNLENAPIEALEMRALKLLHLAKSMRGTEPLTKH